MVNGADAERPHDPYKLWGSRTYMTASNLYELSG
jgi:hypothetical protein